MPKDKTELVIRKRGTNKYIHALPKELGDFELVPEEQASTFDSVDEVEGCMKNLKILMNSKFVIAKKTR